MVVKLVKEGKRKAWTVPYVVRKLSGPEWAQLRDAPKQEAQKRKHKLSLKVKDAVPFGRYPCYMQSKGVGWCQATIMQESAELSYRIFGMYISLAVEVKSLRKDDKVQIWDQGEKYDTKDMKMKLQTDNEGWRFLITTTKAREMIINNRANWLKYNIQMIKDQEKEDKKMAKKRMGPAARTLLRLQNGPPAVGTGSTRRKSKRAADVKGKTPSPASTPPVKRSRRVSPRSAGARSRKSVKSKTVKRKLKAEFARKKKTQKRLFGQSYDLQMLERVLHSDKSWAYHVQTSPHDVVSRIFNVFKIGGDVDLLFHACMRLLNQVDDGVKQYEAKFFRDAAQKTIRAQLDKNNSILNELGTQIDDLKTTVKGCRDKVYDDDNTSTKTQSNNDGAIVIDLASNTSSDNDQPAKPKGSGKEPAAAVKVEGPNQTDFTQADMDFESSRLIPQTKSARAHFRKCYPHGYPDDKDFVKHAHYHASKRSSSSGYQNVGKASSARREKWRVKIDSTTVGRYNKLAEACEVVYWQLKQAREMAEYASDTFPSDMLE